MLKTIVKNKLLAIRCFVLGYLRTLHLGYSVKQNEYKKDKQTLGIITHFAGF
jgi:hypothetical protein